ncbi:MAG: hypothetical protein HZR80_19055 [Candidatus Heimdallarchaeota archaeon]
MNEVFIVNINKYAFIKIVLVGLLFTIFLPIEHTQARSIPHSKVIISEDFAYIFVEEDGLQTVDISNPSNPQFVSHLKIDGYCCWHICFDNDFVYLAIDTDDSYIILDIFIVNVSDPKKPSVVGTIDLNLGLQMKMNVYENYLYIARGDLQMEIYDVSNPKYPVKIKTYTDYGVSDVFVIDNKAYLACESTGLIVLNVSNPNSCVFLYNYSALTDYEGDIEGSAVSILVDDHYVYLFTEGYHKCWIIDITNPINMIEVGNYYTNYASSEISISSNILYGINQKALRIVDLSNPGTPVEYPSYEINEGSNGLYSKSNLTFITTDKRELMILDSTNLDALIIVSNYEIYLQNLFIRNILLISISSIILIGVVFFVIVRRKQLYSQGIKVKEWFKGINVKEWFIKNKNEMISERRASEGLRRPVLIALIGSLVIVVVSITYTLYLIRFDDWYLGIVLGITLVPISLFILIVAPLIAWRFIPTRKHGNSDQEEL